MQVAPTVPHDEQARLAAVRRFDLPDSSHDGAFDRLTALAARLCDVPLATVTLVDEHHVRFLSAHGAEIEQIDRTPGLCASAILDGEPYVVTDASTDPRTLDHPLVRGDLGVRFYAAVPLCAADGQIVGTLNVLDVRPRELCPDALAHLQDLADIAMDQLELRASRQAIATESQREAAGYRDALLAGISHEIRTPIAILQGVVSMAEATPPASAAEARLRTVLARQVRYLEWLVGQYLDFALLENPHHRPSADLAPLTLAAVVEDAVELFRDRAEVEVEIAPATPMALADRARTQRIVTELLNNAVRFGGNRAPIRIEVGTGGVDDVVQVSVLDSGPGIAPAELTGIFDRFTRDPRSTGTGVGLFVSQAAARVQGGRIEVVSTPGAGSCFTLILPRA